MSHTVKHAIKRFPMEMSPCYNVLRTCRAFVKDHNSYASTSNDPINIATIDPQALQRLGEQIAPQIYSTIKSDIARETKKESGDASNKDSTTWAEWDEEGWHYTAANFQGSIAERKERATLYILALDAINFCFWPHPSSPSFHTQQQQAQFENNTLEYDHLAIALRKLAEQDEGDTSSSTYFFSPKNLATMTVAQFEKATEPYLQNHSIPNIEERVRLWNELGYGLLTHFQGQAMNLIEQSQRHGPKCVSLILSTFPGFRDESVCPRTGKWICFYKRAQIAVGDLRQALGEVNDSSYQWTGMDELTTFADYRVPQLLRHVSVLDYCSTLAAQIDEGIEIPCNSMEELSIRASTVVAVDSLVSVVRSIVKSQMMMNVETAHESSSIDAILFDKVTAVTLDWYLWQEGEKLQQQGKMKPHHKTRTIFY
eukprot:CAMPEP_0195287144 /NCGR_PEP_ID=MMETSP0707-20130614/4331_1 /TAXON_ID=33640 /ORGANISM="Asterionellopsis glacialis, Strain CCMP134" /LENGTH=425 /DNA_ID=CAMNT_0040346873 /DNA_START=134 /DNA_END=1411 /DNA_ORIENTATION=+